MSGPGFSYGLSIKKKPLGHRPQLAKRKPIFNADDDSDEDNKGSSARIEEIGEIGGGLQDSEPSASSQPLSSRPKSSKPSLKFTSKDAPVSMYGDLSASFTSKKHADTAEELDANIYDYDAVYDSLKPKKKITEADIERKPKYMSNLLAAAAVRKRDATIAEEKKLAKDREAEGDEFADKEKFVTSAYKKQQEENRRLEQEEKVREAEEAKKNKGKGMTSFYKGLLEKGEQKHAEVVKAVEDRIKNGPVEEDDLEREKSEKDRAREINERDGGKIAVNEEGEVVDKRQLLKGGLNIVSKPKTSLNAAQGGVSVSSKGRDAGFVGAGGGKQAMRERQTRMMEAQLEQATKRAHEQDVEEEAKVERASKSQKTEGDIMSAKERYLARKREAEEARKRGETAT